MGFFMITLTYIGTTVTCMLLSAGLNYFPSLVYFSLWRLVRKNNFDILYRAEQSLLCVTQLPVLPLVSSYDNTQRNRKLLSKYEMCYISVCLTKRGGWEFASCAAAERMCGTRPGVIRCSLFPHTGGETGRLRQ